MNSEPLNAGALQSLKDDILAARNLLNRMLGLAAHHGVDVEVRLVSVQNVGAARAGILQHWLVEALPASS